MKDFRNLIFCNISWVFKKKCLITFRNNEQSCCGATLLQNNTATVLIHNQPKLFPFISDDAICVVGTIFEGPKKIIKLINQCTSQFFFEHISFLLVNGFYPIRFLCTYLYPVHISPWQFQRHQIICCAKKYFLHICSRQFWSDQIISCAKICLVHTGCFFDWSVLKMSKCQTLRKF